MFRSIATLVLFVWICCHTQAEDEKLYKCTAWGDPHVTRFPSEETEQPQEVWCQETGWQTLLKNKYVHLSTKVSEKPYVISEFNMVISDDNGNTVCVLNQNNFLSSPPDCGEDIKITNNGNFMTIQYKKNDILIEIQKYTYNQQNIPSIYSLWVSQSSYLIEQSTGVCVTSCDPNSGKILTRRQRALTNTPENSDQNSIRKSAESICETLISKVVPGFKITSLKRMDINTRNSYSACVTDLKLTGDLTFAKASVQALAVNTILDGVTTKSDFEEVSKNIIGRVGETNTLLNKEIAQIGKPTSPSSDDITEVYADNQNTKISCQQTWSSIIKIVSAVMESTSSSCTVDVTEHVKQLCDKAPRLCKFAVSQGKLQTADCPRELKQLKVVYRCEKKVN